MLWVTYNQHWECGHRTLTPDTAQVCGSAVHAWMKGVLALMHSITKECEIKCGLRIALTKYGKVWDKNSIALIQPLVQGFAALEPETLVRQKGKRKSKLTKKCEISLSTGNATIWEGCISQVSLNTQDSWKQSAGVPNAGQSSTSSSSSPLQTKTVRTEKRQNRNDQHQPAQKHKAQQYC